MLFSTILLFTSAEPTLLSERPAVTRALRPLPVINLDFERSALCSAALKNSAFPAPLIKTRQSLRGVMCLLIFSQR